MGYIYNPFPLGPNIKHPSQDQNTYSDSEKACV